MAVLLESLRSTGDQRRYFHATYQRTTIAVAEELQRGGFTDADWVERWDVAFADLYLDALQAALAGRRPTRPWDVAFNAPADLPPLRHVLLGMNAHINFDLPQALLAVITDEQFDDAALLARRESDHQAIDNVLASRVAAEDDELASISGPGSPLDRLLRPLNRLGTQRFLREAREKVWANAIVLSRARRQGPDAYATCAGTAGGTERGEGRGLAGTWPGPAEARHHRLRRPAAWVAAPQRLRTRRRTRPRR